MSVFQVVLATLASIAAVNGIFSYAVTKGKEAEAKGDGALRAFYVFAPFWEIPLVLWAIWGFAA